MTPRDYIEAARVPRSLQPQEFGLWKIERLSCGQLIVEDRLVVLSEKTVGFPDYTMLSHWTEATLHRVRGDIVMEDSQQELRKHLPIWLAAKGRVLITGLGLGCVVRGLLANRDVDYVEVVEIDYDIARIVGAEFAGSQRVNITVGDALTVDLPGRFDFAWHDLWVDGPELHILHARLFARFLRQCGPHGAWAFPRRFAKVYATMKSFNLLGAPRYG